MKYYMCYMVCICTLENARLLSFLENAAKLLRWPFPHSINLHPGINNIQGQFTNTQDIYSSQI